MTPSPESRAREWHDRHRGPALSWDSLHTAGREAVIAKFADAFGAGERHGIERAAEIVDGPGMTPHSTSIRGALAAEIRALPVSR